MPSELTKGIGIGMLAYIGLGYITNYIHLGAFTLWIGIILAFYLIFLSKK